MYYLTSCEALSALSFVVVHHRCSPRYVNVVNASLEADNIVILLVVYLAIKYSFRDDYDDVNM